MFRRLTRQHIREVVPEVIPPDAAIPRPETESLKVANARANGNAMPTPLPMPEAEPEAVEPLWEPATTEVELVSAEEPARIDEPANVAPDELVCVISLWQGYRKSRFYAQMEEDGEEVAVAESTLFRTPPEDSPLEASEEAIAAYEALRAELEARGWLHASRGDDWFSDTFRRPL